MCELEADIAKANNGAQGSARQFKEEYIMVVQHNLTAMNSNRMLGITTKSQAKSTEKLSSGYKINRAADDAAGLSISEKMRKQIRGLTQASSNAQDGISAVQTAEGALNEVQDMLQRMNELAVKSANGTNSEDDRKYIQDEVDQLLTEIDRVSTTTKFNETYLLKGDADKNQKTDTVFENFDTTAAVAKMATGSTFTASKAGFDETTGEIKYTFTSGLKVGDTYDGITVIDDAGTEDATHLKLANAKKKEIDNVKTELAKVATGTFAEGEVTYKSITSNDYTYNDAISLDLHVGADSTADNKINMSISSMSTAGLHITGLQVGGSDGSNATKAIDKISAAIQTVSTQRSALGAIQNRLEHTINNLDNVVENTTSAESQIRDTDMATEMVKYSNNNILAQAGQAMLAQSNQSNQGVLSLLQ